MKTKELKQQASDMIEYCAENRSCKDCPFDKLCNDSGFADHDCHLTVENIMEAITNKGRSDD